MWKRIECLRRIESPKKRKEKVPSKQKRKKNSIRLLPGLYSLVWWTWSKHSGKNMNKENNLKEVSLGTYKDPTYLPRNIRYSPNLRTIFYGSYGIPIDSSPGSCSFVGALFIRCMRLICFSYLPWIGKNILPSFRNHSICRSFLSIATNAQWNIF